MTVRELIPILMEMDTEWLIGGRDMAGNITSYKCSNCGYRIKPNYLLKKCPNCSSYMQSKTPPHYHVSLEKDGWWHYKAVAINKLMKATINGEKEYRGIKDIYVNDALKKIKLIFLQDPEYETEFTSFVIGTYDVETKED